MTVRPVPTLSPARRVLVAVLAGLLLLVGAPPVARAASVEVRIGAGLQPTSVSVAAGTTVTWVNADDERHRVRAVDDAPEEFDSGNLEPGERFSHTFRATGTTRYVDERDEDDTRYHGSVVVGSQSTPQSGTGASGASQPQSGTAQSGTAQSGAAQSGTARPSGPATHSVSMAGRRFSPVSLRITAGDTVRFLNDDDRDHTATADDDSFDSGVLAEGGEYRRTFQRAGTFSYLCLLHPDMTGTIAVAGAGGTAPPPRSPTPASAPAPSAHAASSTPGSTPSDGDAAAPRRRTVEMRDVSFAPTSVTVPAGSTVVFQNTGRAPHTATAADGSFDSGMVAAGDAHEQRFDRPGTFDYTCLLHPQMTGEVVVTAAAGASPAAGPRPSASESAAGPSAEPDGTATEATGAAGGGATDPAAPATVPAAVSVVDDEFLPAALEVTVGQEVVWTNDGEAAHTVTAEDGSFDSGIVAAGATFRRTFEEPGTVAYLCAVHPGMTAEVRVLALADDTRSPATAPAAAGVGGGPSTALLQLLMLGVFAIALGGFTALSRRFAALDPGADASR